LQIKIIYLGIPLLMDGKGNGQLDLEGFDN